ncbi:tetratricopeptide repeat protein [Flavobacterium ustbae]|uniref:tetratricopeptide repeat protein n=1 Tax=Flavobacterium ustbae TaxID=2488790 RepID=UPI000F76FDA6|nr:tetratricopeptide repeat protein [Flavobacterium ustbae]
MSYAKTDRLSEIKKTLAKAHAFSKVEKGDSAYFYFNKTQLLCEPKEDYADYYVESLNHMAEILQRQGDYYKVETILVKALPYLDKTTNVKYAVNTYTFMAYNYDITYDNEKALYYHRKALKKAFSTFRKSRIISEIAFVYVQEGKYQEAVDLLEPIAWLNIEDKITPSNTGFQRSAKLYNLGLSYLYLGNHKKEAFDCFTESLKVALTLNDDYELITSYYALYKYYEKYNNPKLKKINIEKAYYYAKKSNSKSYAVSMLGCLIEADNAANSKKNFKIYSRMLDSLIVSRKKAKNQFADIIYNSQKDKDENLELKNHKAENELKLQRQKNRSYISYIVISISIISLIFIFFYITIKGKKERNNEVFKNEMRISEKLQFELEKDIDKILLFTENYDLEKEENKEKLLSHLNNIYLKTRNISRENSEIATDENFEKALKEMISGYTNQNINIIINGLHTFSWCKIARVKKITVFRVLQEIFDQMKTLNNASLASITFKKEEKNILIMYSDNGNEISSKNIVLEKRLQNVENRIKTIKGTLNFGTYSESGFKISFKFPI